MTVILRLTAILALTLAATTAADAEDLTAGKPFPVTWQYSTDAGKTWSPDPPQVAPARTPDGLKPTLFKAAFTVDDPAKIGALKLMTHGTDGAIALTTADSVDRYNVGSHPTLVQAKLVLNGKATTAGHLPYTLYKYLTLDPELLRKGENTLEVSGIVWFAHHAGKLPGQLRFEVIPPDRAALDRLPVLGAPGGNDFALSARAIIPSTFTVTAKPLKPVGQPVSIEFPRGRTLKAKLSLPAGTQTFEYSVTVKTTAAEKTYGPYKSALPTIGPGFRFIVGGGTRIYDHHPKGLEKFFATLLRQKPDLFIHTGYYQNCQAWDWRWTHGFIRRGYPTLASVPMLPVCGISEMLSPILFANAFYFPPEDRDYGHWTVAYGPVRFVAIEAFSQSQAKDPAAAAKWLDDVLATCKEPYVIVLNNHVSQLHHEYASRGARDGIKHTAKHIDPILIKHKVTCTIGGYQQIYQRMEPPADKGVPTILTAKAGGLGWAFRQNVATENPHSKFASGAHHYVVFELLKDTLVLKAIKLEDGTVMDTRVFTPRK